MLCPVLPAVDHMTANSHNRTSGSTVMFHCTPGYSLIGTAHIYCQPNGTWNSTLPSCTVTPVSSARNSLTSSLANSVSEVASLPSNTNSKTYTSKHHTVFASNSEVGSTATIRMAVPSSEPKGTRTCIAQYNRMMLT